MASLLKTNTKIKMFLEGSVNGHKFKCEGVGEGNPFEGTHEMKITVTEGAPLPFAFDILRPCGSYGSKTFMKHTAGIPDYYKESFPEGFTWERTTAYEDGGYLTVYHDTSLEGNCLIYKVKVVGTNFPADGPVMKKKSLGWKPWAEIVYPYHGVLYGRSMMALEVQDGPPLFCQIFTTYRTKKPVGALKMPEYHFGFYSLQGKQGRNEIFQHSERSLAKYPEV